MARQKLLEVCWAGTGNLRSGAWSWGAWGALDTLWARAHKTCRWLECGATRGDLLVWGYTGLSGQAVEKVSNFGILNTYLCCFIYVFALMDFNNLYYSTVY